MDSETIREAAEGFRRLCDDYDSWAMGDKTHAMLTRRLEQEEDALHALADAARRYADLLDGGFLCRDCGQPPNEGFPDTDRQGRAMLRLACTRHEMAVEVEGVPNVGGHRG